MPPPLGPRISLSFRFSLPYTTGHVRSYTPRAHAAAATAVLATTRAEMDAIGWDSLDILLVTGDAYVDHPSFGVPLLGRWLVGHG